MIAELRLVDILMTWLDWLLISGVVTHSYLSSSDLPTRAFRRFSHSSESYVLRNKFTGGCKYRVFLSETNEPQHGPVLDRSGKTFSHLVEVILDFWVNSFPVQGIQDAP